MNFKPLTDNEEVIANKIVDSAYSVHQKLGPGLIEKIYEVCFCHDLTKRGLHYQRQAEIQIIYDGMIFDQGLRLDVLVEDLIICEIKAVEQMNSLWRAQLLSFLKLTDKRLGFIINFNTELIKNGIERIIL